MRRFSALVRATRGASAVEFALVAPVLIAFLIGFAQVGILFASRAGLKQAVAEGARYATIYPTPSDKDIAKRAISKGFFLQPASIVGPTISHGGGSESPFVEISMGYKVPLNFVFFSLPPVTLSQTRRAYVQ